jgi:hypothetical protein
VITIAGIFALVRSWSGRRAFVGSNLKPPEWIDLPLRALQYILLGLFLWVVATMDRNQILAIMNSPYYKLSDAKMLLFFTRISILAASVLFMITRRGWQPLRPLKTVIHPSISRSRRDALPSGM